MRKPKALTKKRQETLDAFLGKVGRTGKVVHLSPCCKKLMTCVDGSACPCGKVFVKGG